MEPSALSPADRANLDHFFLFQHLSPPVVERLLDDPRLQCVTYAKGEVIFDPAHFDPALGLVLSGKIEASQSGQGRGLILRHHQSGDVFGAATMFLQNPDYSTRLEALTKTRVLFFPQELLRSYMAAEFQIAENYIAFLTGRVQFLTGRIGSLLAGSAEAQLMSFLADQSDEAGVVSLDISISALARRLGISRASLYRAFTALEQKELLKKSGKTIILHNVR